MSDEYPQGTCVPVARSELVTRDLALISEMGRQVYVDHRVRFHCDDPRRVRGDLRWAVTDDVAGGIVSYGGLVCEAKTEPPDVLNAIVVKRGRGGFASGGEELRYAPGRALILPADRPGVALLDDVAIATLQVSSAVAGDLAEEFTGLRPGELRFTGITPVSRFRQAELAAAVDFICAQLVTSAVHEIPSLVAQQLTRLAGVALLRTFPNTALTAVDRPASGLGRAADGRPGGRLHRRLRGPAGLRQPDRGRGRGASRRAAVRVPAPLRHLAGSLPAAGPPGTRPAGAGRGRPGRPGHRDGGRPAVGLGRPGPVRRRLPAAVRRPPGGGPHGLTQ